MIFYFFIEVNVFYLNSGTYYLLIICFYRRLVYLLQYRGALRVILKKYSRNAAVIVNRWKIDFI